MESIRDIFNRKTTKMRDIIFECDVTEYGTSPKEENDTNEFWLTNECLIIGLKDKDGNYFEKTEIDKDAAIELAQIILLKYKK